MPPDPGVLHASVPRDDVAPGRPFDRTTPFYVLLSD